jgi:hypothetical protein
MAMTLIYSRVCRKEVQVLLPCDIPHMDSRSPAQYYRQRVVVVSAIVMLKLEIAIGNGR